MADKDITIGIGVTGAEKAAADIKKVDKAQDELTKQSGDIIGFGDNGRAAAIRRQEAAREEALRKEIQLREAAAEAATKQKEAAVLAAKETEQAERDLAAAREKSEGGESSGSGSSAGALLGGSRAGKFIAQNREMIAGAAKGAAALAAIGIAAQVASAGIDNALGKLQEAGTDMDKLRDANPEEFGFLKVVQAIGSPLDTIKGLMADIMDASINGLLDMDALKRSAIQAGEMAHQLERSKTAIDALSQSDKELRLNNLQQAVILLRAENNELDRQQKIKSAQRSLDSTQGAIADAKAITGTNLVPGADPLAVKSARAVADAAVEADKLRDGLAKLDVAIRQSAIGVDDARAIEQEAKFAAKRLAFEYDESARALINARVELATDLAGGGVGEKQTAAVQAAELAFDQARDAYDKGTQAINSAAVKTVDAEQAYADAQADFENQKQVNAIKLQELGAQTTAEIEKAATDIQTKTAEAGQAMVEKVIGTGSKLTELQEQAKTNLDKILNDGKIATDEQNAFQQNFLTLISGMKQTTEGFSESARNANELIDKQNSVLSQIKQEQRRLADRINQIK